MVLTFFTFQYGSIKSTVKAKVRIQNETLHSSMVLLNLAKHIAHVFNNDINFTFQYGSIKSGRRYEDSLYYQVFTFQYGSIKSAKINLVPAAKMIFTFQYGSIKSC